MNLIKDLFRVVGTHMIDWANTPDTPAQPAASVAPVVPAPILRVPVQSSMIASVGYRAADRTLEIEFVGGAVYRYADVPGDLFDDMVDDASVGKFFNRSIRDQFTHTKVDE